MLVPTGDRILRAAKDAFRDPWTFVPAAMAGVLSIGDYDEEVSDWAFDETPLFGSVEDAEDASDDFRDLLSVLSLASTLATNSGDDPKTWFTSKAKGALVGLAANAISDEAVDLIKTSTERSRPNGRNNRSMPSMHTSAAASDAAWISRNLDSTSMSSGLRETLRYGTRLLSIGTGWGRIESGNHYPTDVLLGAALGNFITNFLHDSFLGLPLGTEVTVQASVGGEPFLVGVRWQF